MKIVFIMFLIKMLKIVHLLTGIAALLLSLIPSLRSDAVPYLQQPDALYLALLGLLNLLLAPVVPAWAKGLRNQLQGVVSALLVLAVVLQTLILLAPLSTIGDQPAILLSLLAVIAGLAWYFWYEPGVGLHLPDMPSFPDMPAFTGPGSLKFPEPDFPAESRRLSLFYVFIAATFLGLAGLDLYLRRRRHNVMKTNGHPHR